VATDKPYFNELLTLYSAIHALHSALGQITDVETDPTLGSGDLLQDFTAFNLAKLTAKAASDITAGRFLELFVSGGVFYVRHVVVTASSQSYGVCGISLEDVPAGGIVTILTEPTIVPGFSGLTPGYIYYAYDGGTFTTQSYADFSGVIKHLPECGVAVSPTHLRLKSRI